ncbi:MAG: DUF4097 domain-containing protein [Thermoanaerobaculia bacterium]
MTKFRDRIGALAIVAALGMAIPAVAQVEIDRRRPAPARGEVRIESDFGAITVRGWERNEVQVRGTVAAGAESFDLDGDKEGVSISVDVPDAWMQASAEDPAFRSTLEVMVPAGSHIDLESVNAVVAVEGVTGRVEIRTVNGPVRVAGAPAAVEIETMTGAIEVHALAAPMEIESISGTVVVEGATGEVRIKTVSGRVSVGGKGVAALEVSTTTGPVDFTGSLARSGEIDIETFSSPVALHLPATTRAVFDLQTFGAKIDSQFCAGTPVIRKPFEPFRELRCSTGPDEFEIRVRTHDADITVEAR